MMSLFYFSCKKKEILPKHNNLDVRDTENIPDFSALAFSVEDCHKFTDLQLLYDFLKQDYKTIPYTLSTQNRLTTLHLNGTLMSKKIGVIPEQLACFTELEDLTLNNQDIRSLENEGLWNLNRLKTLDLSNNPLKKININNFSKLKQLKFLYLHGTGLSRADQNRLQNELQKINVQVSF
jgi:Leucine-rich repeat (LRR) protein